MRRTSAVVSLALLASTAVAQTRTPAPAAPVVEASGIVTGHVFCSDTNQPARFAKVSLEPVHADATQAVKGVKIQGGSFTGNGVISVDTALDGSFTLSKVKPGSYYVIVSKAGYVSPRAMFTQKEIDNPSDAMRSIIERALPRVDVDNNQSAHAEVRLERGGAISGTISYDDGSPAGELTVTLLHKDSTGKWAPLEGIGSRTAGWTSTDDRGQFRFSSLLPDEYLVKAQLTLGSSRESSIGGPNGTQMVFNMMTFRSSLSFYGGGSPHESDAKPIKLLPGGELTSQDMTLPISKLFRLSGHVVAGRNGHVVNAADLRLISKDDGKELTTSDIDREDGLFHFDFVPAGDYTLQISNARDVVWEAEHLAPGAPASPFPAKDKERTIESYGSTDLPLIVSGDMIGMNATVPPDAKKQQDARPVTSSDN